MTRMSMTVILVLHAAEVIPAAHPRRNLAHDLQQTVMGYLQRNLNNLFTVSYTVYTVK